MVHSEASKCSEIDAMNDGLNEEKGASCFQEDTGKRKRKKSVRFGIKISIPHIDLFPFSSSYLGLWGFAFHFCSAIF